MPKSRTRRLGVHRLTLLMGEEKKKSFSSLLVK